MPALTQAADSAYRVRVLHEEPRQDEKTGLIFRRLSVEVLEVFKGRWPSQSIVKVELPGGKKGNEGLHISGIPHLAVGEEYILFLEADWGSGVNRLSGWSAYLVVSDQRGDRFIVSAPESSIEKRTHDIRASQLRSASSYQNFVTEIFSSY
ncbi:MAG: hypothetical protein EA369_06580 [Bradymonadales bacterium]|nr:MAG: hypothetical protein EA369_06580 [Bradymonadales bacterium]